MKNTPRKKDSTSHKEEDEPLNPLVVSNFEPQQLRPQFTYINPSVGHQIHQSLMGTRLFSPVLTPKHTRKKIAGESVFKTPNSAGMQSAERKSNGLRTPESRSAKQEE